MPHELNEELFRKAYDAADPHPEIAEWVGIMAGRGLEYYAGRIAMLGVSGGRALDAGCGNGVFSFAMTRFFDRVDALEKDPLRLEVLEQANQTLKAPVIPCLGTLEELPYEDDSFDFVFCNGVIFLTDFRRSLAELYRVLAPGALLYVSFNHLGWWTLLKEERSKEDPACSTYADNAFLHTAHQIMDDLELETCFDDGSRTVLLEALKKQRGNGLLQRLFPAGPDKLLARCVLAGDEGAGLREAVYGELLTAVQKAGVKDAPSCMELVECCRMLHVHGSDAHREGLFRDALWRALKGTPQYDLKTRTMSFSEHRMKQELARAGFAACVTGHEGHLLRDASVTPVPPLYEKRQEVFEALALKGGGGSGKA